MLEPVPGSPDAILLHIKVVPGSSRDAIAGVLGTRLKIKVAAAPEKGRANAAVIELLAQILQLPTSAFTLIKGHTAPEKTLQMRGISLESARRILLDQA